MSARKLLASAVLDGLKVAGIREFDERMKQDMIAQAIADMGLSEDDAENLEEEDEEIEEPGKDPGEERPDPKNPPSREKSPESPDKNQSSIFNPEPPSKQDDNDEIEEPSKPRGQPVRDVTAKVDLDVEDIAFSINTIRSGKSLRDAETGKRVYEYYKSLDDSERVALHKLLRGLAQVIVGGVDAEQAIDPSDEPRPVHMNVDSEEGDSGVKVKRSQLSRKSRGQEDMTPPARTVPGANESRERLKKMIRDLVGDMT